VADRLPAAEKACQAGQRRPRRARLAQIGRPDPGQPLHRLRHRAAGVDQALQAIEDAVGCEGHRPDLDHTVVVGVEAGRFKVEGNVLGHCSKFGSRGF